MPDPTFEGRIVLVRHGATAWSRSRRHTGRSDIPLDDEGRLQAASLRDALSGMSIDLVLVSPLSRAVETAELSGLAAAVDGRRVERCDDLEEWDYGRYEGLTTEQIRTTSPGWTVFDDGCPDGEKIDDVSARADRVLARVASSSAGQVALVAHAHLLRVLAARWLRQPGVFGRHLTLDPASWSVLAHEHESTVLESWNLTPRGPR